jgi:hypothetical protein
MTRANPTRHNLPVALFLTTLLILIPAAQAGAATTGGAATTPQVAVDDRYHSVPAKVCAIDWRKGTWHVKKLIRCAAFRYQVPGGAAKALAIADRESSFYPRAYNSYSGASGVFQHLKRYWPGRAHAFGFKGWSAFNARANIIVSMRMVKRHGWAPWGY